MYSTLKEFQKRFQDLSEKYGGDRGLLGYIITRWSQGRHLNLPLEMVEPLLVKRGEIKRLVNQAVKRLIEFFQFSYGGSEGRVEIFAISSPQRTYGTGKSQIAIFIAKELEKKGIKTRFLSYASKTHPKKPILPKIFIVHLLSGGLDEKLAVFIDELDLLVAPGLTAEEQAKAIEGFANALIEYTESLPRRGIRHAVIPILSYRVEEEIKHVARDRLSRRLLNVIARVSIDLDEESIYRIFETTTILSALYEGLVASSMSPDLNLLIFLHGFAKDYAKWLWPSEDVAGLPVGTVIAKAMNLSLLYAQSLKEGTPSLDSLNDPAKLGRLCEDTLKETLRRLLPRHTVKVGRGEEEYTVTWVLNTAPSKVSRSRADMRYLARIGAVDIGSVAVEVTAEKSLSNHKRSQISDYASQGPVLLVHLYVNEEDKRRMAEDIDSLAPLNPVELLQLPLPLFKYPAVLGKAGGELAYTVAEERSLTETLKAVLGRAAEILFARWIAAVKIREAAEASSKEEAEKKLTDAFLKAAMSFVISLKFVDAKGKRHRRTIGKMTNILLGSISQSLSREISKEAAKELAESIAKEWDHHHLGKKTPKQFSPGDKWNDEEAARIAAEVMRELLMGTLTKSKSTESI